MAAMATVGGDGVTGSGLAHAVMEVCVELRALRPLAWGTPLEAVAAFVGALDGWVGVPDDGEAARTERELARDPFGCAIGVCSQVV